MDQLRNFEQPNKKFYETVEDIYKQQHREQVRYDIVSAIPNALKTNENNRQFVIQEISAGKIILANEIQIEKSPVVIHLIAGKIWQNSRNRDTGATRHSLVPTPLTQIWSNQDLQRLHLTFTTDRKALIAYERIQMEKETERNNEKETYNIDITEEEVKHRKSVLRNNYTDQEIHKRIIFLDAEFARTVNNTNTPVAVTMLGYDGRTILNTLCNPRQKIRNYESRYHGLTEKELRGQPDSEEIVARIQELVKGKILIGSDLGMELKGLRIDKNQIAGIRDLANAISIRNILQCETQLMGLSTMAEKILKRKIQQGPHMAKEDTDAVRDIYIMTEKNWQDHKRNMDWCDIVDSDEMDCEDSIELLAPEDDIEIIKAKIIKNIQVETKQQIGQAENNILKQRTMVPEKINEVFRTKTQLEKGTQIIHSTVQEFGFQTMEVEERNQNTQTMSEQRSMETQTIPNIETLSKNHNDTQTIIVQFLKDAKIKITGDNIKVEFI